jgi:hypothetical protein
MQPAVICSRSRRGHPAAALDDETQQRVIHRRRGAHRPRPHILGIVLLAAPATPIRQDSPSGSEYHDPSIRDARLADAETEPGTGLRQVVPPVGGVKQRPLHPAAESA